MCAFWESNPWPWHSYCNALLWGMFVFSKCMYVCNSVFQYEVLSSHRTPHRAQLWTLWTEIPGLIHQHIEICALITGRSPMFWHVFTFLYSLICISSWEVPCGRSLFMTIHLFRKFWVLSQGIPTVLERQSALREYWAWRQRSDFFTFRIIIMQYVACLLVH